MILATLELIICVKKYQFYFFCIVPKEPKNISRRYERFLSFHSSNCSEMLVLLDVAYFSAVAGLFDLNSHTYICTIKNKIFFCAQIVRDLWNITIFSADHNFK